MFQSNLRLVNPLRWCSEKICLYEILKFTKIMEVYLKHQVKRIKINLYVSIKPATCRSSARRWCSDRSARSRPRPSCPPACPSPSSRAPISRSSPPPSPPSQLSRHKQIDCGVVNKLTVTSLCVMRA